jgi:hypothetical protein
MSLYGIVFGDDDRSQRGATLLAMLGFESFGDVGRFRDAWVERGGDDQPVIAIYTRNGGGNRGCWGEHLDGPCTGCIAEHELPQHPLYLRDADDEFDTTYATFYFRAPEEHRELLREVMGDPVDMDERWQAAIEGLRAPARTAAEPPIKAEGTETP